MEDKKYFWGNSDIDRFWSDAQELSLDDLDGIAGGRIKAGGYGMLTGAILIAKKQGYDKEFCLQMVRTAWETNAEFKTRFTDGTDADLEKALAFVEKTW